ncbi:HD domain-containing protein [Candidatus Gottesmanbacteria bacterium]|nr:HD domain-containing protein [Candidatus Gottesmanbacteria bacterium]
MTTIILPEEVQNILHTLKRAGFEGFVVGGGIRNAILHKPTVNWDFTTNAKPQEILTLFKNSFYNNTFGTVGVAVQLKNPFKKSGKLSVIFEITTYRSEFGYSDHRHPDKIVWGETLDEDLKRRDFTMNALAFDGVRIVDLFGGIKDIKKKIVRAVGDGQARFAEDALRMVRAVRFATEYSFTIDPDTSSAISKNAALIASISGERIREELIKILSSDFPSDGIRLLKNTGLLSFILPELEKCFGIEQKSPKRHHVHDVGTHLLLSLSHCPSKDPIVRLATLLHDVGKPATFQKTDEGIITFYNHEIIGASIVRHIADRLHLSKNEREKLVTLVRFHQFTVDEKQTDSAIRRFIRNIGKENIDDMLALRTGDRLGGGARQTSWRLELYKKRLEDVQKQPFTVSDLKVDGHDVMKVFDISPGPKVGKILEMLFTQVVEGKLKNEKELLLEKISEFSEKKIV